MGEKRKLSKTVLEMKFMKRSKIQQDKHDAENENIDVLTDQRIKGEKQSFFIIERNWDIIENLRCSRLNYGMSTKNQDTSGTQETKEAQDNDDYERNEPKAKKKK